MASPANPAHFRPRMGIRKLRAVVRLGSVLLRVFTCRFQ